MKHNISRVRHELHRRSLTVQRSEHLTPRMLRLTLAGESLANFTSMSPDDHLKIFVPDEKGIEQRRDYTPRRYVAEKNTLIIDFALHEAGPITRWAENAKVGDQVDIGGPRGSVVVDLDFDWWLLIGDETALPAIGRRVEELPTGTQVTTIVAVTGPEEQQSFTTQAKHEAVWVHRPAAQADDPAPLLVALGKHKRPAGDGFIWAAAEGGVARALRKAITDDMGHPSDWSRISGYWVKGKADTSEK